MPRLPRILADAPQTSGGSSYRAPMPSDNGLASAVSRAGASISNALAGFADLEREKKNVASKQEADLLVAEQERDVAIAESNLKTLYRDPDEYLREHRKMLEDVTTATRKRASSGEVAARFDVRTAGYLGRKVADGHVHSNSLFKERGLANLDATISNRKMLAGQAMDDTVFNQQIKEGVQAYKDATWLLGEDKAGDAIRTFKLETFGARAYTESKNQPERFLETADQRYGNELPEKTLTTLKLEAQNAVDSRRKSNNQEWEAYYTRIEKEAEIERTSQLRGLFARAAKGELTVRELDDAGSMRIVENTGEYQTLLKAIKDAGNTPSDKATLDYIQVRSRDPNPRISVPEIWKFYDAKLINRADALTEIEKVNAAMSGREGQGRTEREQRIGDAKGLMKAMVGLAANDDKHDDQDKSLWAKMLDEFTGRVVLGTEDPFEVAGEIGGRIAPIRSKRLSMDASDIKQSLPPGLRSNTPMEAKQRLNDMVQSGRWSRGAIDAWRRSILDWERKEIESGTIGKTGGGAKTEESGPAPMRTGGGAQPKGGNTK
jgi:hypothetical protein